MQTPWIVALWLALASPPEPEPELEDVGRVASVELDGEPTPEQLARLEVDAPGLTLRSPGGLGRFGAIALRRGGSLAIPVFIDGALLLAGVAGPVDLHSLPLFGPGRVELHRQLAPIRYGPTPVGGAIDFVGDLHEGPARGWARAGFGSFLTREAEGGFVLSVRPRLSLAGRVDYAGSRGDFSYYDDGGTRYLFGDDHVRRRASNHYDRVGAALRVDHRSGPLTVSSLLFGNWRRAGVPAPNRARPSDASLASASLRNITRVRRALRGPGGYVEWVTSLGADGRLFRDPEAALGSAEDDERLASVDLSGSPRLRLPVWRQGFLAITADARGEWIDVRERASELDPAQRSSGDARRSRVIAGVGVELEQWVWDRRWAFAPGIRVDLVSSQFAEPPGAGEPDDLGRDRVEIGFSPRIATSFVLVEGLTLHAGAARTLRPPSLLELFGDRGALAGNEGLRVEAGSAIDGGVRWSITELGDRSVDLLAQATGFSAWSTNAIRWVRTDAVLRPINVEQARVRGLELGASVRAFAGDLAVDLAYALVDGRIIGAPQPGRFVPGVSVHNLSTRVSGGHRFARRRVAVEPRVHYELELASQSFVDLDNRDMLPTRLLHAVGLTLGLGERVTVLAELRGLSHRHWAEVSPGRWPGPYPAANADALGFPLPGPSAWASVRVELGR